MKFSNLLHKTPWWLLVGVGFFGLAALMIFVTPFHLMRLERSGTTVEEKRAIKREIDYAFSEGAIDVARGIVRELKAHTRDPQLKADLERTLGEIEQARSELREAGRDVLRAKREAAANVAEAVRNATQAITSAQREAARALRQAGVDSAKVDRALEESMRAAHEAEMQAREEAEKNASKRIEEAQKRYDEARARAEEQQRNLLGKARKHAKAGSSGKPEIRIDVDDDGHVEVGPLAEAGKEPSVLPTPPVPSVPPLAPLAPELRENIHKQVTGDLYRIGVGAGLILLFIPLFILTVVAKFFIDRSRASLRVADDRRKEAEYHRMSQQVTEAKLQALQAQIEPHFLYNTLASVQALTEVDPQRANTLTGHLIMYLRNALPKMRESISTVQQEIELARSYLNILKMRMGDRLAFEIDVPPNLENAPFPPLMLPTLVENAIKHGLEPLREGGRVTIRAEEHDGILRVSVADTGKGFAENLGSGVGLANIRERLAALYGDKGKLTLEANAPKGVVAAIEVPRDGARIGGAAATDPIVPPPPEPPRGAAARTFAALRTGERVWRKGLSFAFIALVTVAAVVCGLAIVGVLTGLVPVNIGDGTIEGPTGALIGTAGILLGFTLIVIALAIIVAVFYGLGFLLVGIAIFIPLAIIVAMVPALAPFILVGLFVWWLVRRSDRKAAERKAAADSAREPTIESGNADSHPR